MADLASLIKKYDIHIRGYPYLGCKVTWHLVIFSMILYVGPSARCGEIAFHLC